MIDSFLVPVDDTPESERVLPIVAALATRLGARIELLTIDSPHVEVSAMAAYQERLIQALPEGVPGHGTVLLGDAPVAELLLDAYRNRPGALLALATRAPGTLWQWLGGGSVGDEVVQETLRPVLLAGPRCDAGATAAGLAAHTTAALDGTGVDEQVVATATEWARSLGTPLTLVRVVTTPAQPHAHRDAAADVELLAAEARREGLDVRREVVDAGDPARAVLHHVAAAGGVLVVGSHRRGPLGRAIHGSNALWIVHRSPVPVVVAGFATATAGATAPSADDAVDLTASGPVVTPTPCPDLGALVGWSELPSIAIER